MGQGQPALLLSEAEVDYVVRAVVLIARSGWKLLPQYRFSPATGLWRHRDGGPEQAPDLDELLFGAQQHRAAPVPRQRQSDGDDLLGYLIQARRILDAIPSPATPIEPARISPGFDELRWYDLPRVCVGTTGAGEGSSRSTPSARSVLMAASAPRATQVRRSALGLGGRAEAHRDQRIGL